MKLFDKLGRVLLEIKRDAGIGLVKMDTRLRTRHFLPVTPGGLIVPSSEIDEEFLEWLRAHPHDRYPNLWREDEKGRRQAKHRVVTTAFVDFVVDQLQTETSVFGDFKYHEVGTDNTAENASDTALNTPSGIARATGSQTETDHDTYKSVGTITADATENWVEHGLFNASTSGTLMDRTVFAAIGVESGNQVEFTFEISFTAGS